MESGFRILTRPSLQSSRVLPRGPYSVPAEALCFDTRNRGSSSGNPASNPDDYPATSFGSPTGFAYNQGLGRAYSFAKSVCVYADKPPLNSISDSLL
jgi:hypothetical protein